jgi:hypothetical protein
LYENQVGVAKRGWVSPASLPRTQQVTVRPLLPLASFPENVTRSWVSPGAMANQGEAIRAYRPWWFTLSPSAAKLQTQVGFVKSCPSCKRISVAGPGLRSQYAIQPLAAYEPFTAERVQSPGPPSSKSRGGNTSTSPFRKVRLSSTRAPSGQSAPSPSSCDPDAGVCTMTRRRVVAPQVTKFSGAARSTRPMNRAVPS